VTCILIIAVNIAMRDTCSCACYLVAVTFAP